MSKVISLTDAETKALRAVIGQLYRKGDVSTLIRRKDTRAAFAKVLNDTPQPSRCRMRKRKRDRQTT